MQMAVAAAVVATRQLSPQQQVVVKAVDVPQLPQRVGPAQSEESAVRADVLETFRTPVLRRASLAQVVVPPDGSSCTPLREPP